MKHRINVTLSQSIIAWLVNKARERESTVSRVIAELVINEGAREVFAANAKKGKK